MLLGKTFASAHRMKIRASGWNCSPPQGAPADLYPVLYDGMLNVPSPPTFNTGTGIGRRFYQAACGLLAWPHDGGPTAEVVGTAMIFQRPDIQAP